MRRLRVAITQDSLDLAFGERGGLETVGTLTLRMLPVTAGMQDLCPPSP